MSDAVVEMLKEINHRLQRIEYALIPPEKVSKKEARELKKLLDSAVSGDSKNWRDIESELES